MYVGITHETASVAERACFVFDGEQRHTLRHILSSYLGVTASIVLSTCNRTEVYFESDAVKPEEVRDVLISFATSRPSTIYRHTFVLISDSSKALKQLLAVANGLRSAVTGDKQIIAQLKAAYHEALRDRKQGSVLERAFQAVFRSHKRVIAESDFKQGTTSTAYAALKLVESHFGKALLPKLSVLIIGAGEISREVLNYLPKFSFARIHVANRTPQKARELARTYQAETYDWTHVINGDFVDFDVIISAVSHQKGLISEAPADGKARLWVDLAMPANVNPDIVDDHNSLYNIDEVARRISRVNEAQKQAIPTVNKLLKEELDAFDQWLGQADLRAFLKAYKSFIQQQLSLVISETSIEKELQQEAIDWIVHRLVRACAKKLRQFEVDHRPIGRLLRPHEDYRGSFIDLVTCSDKNFRGDFNKQLRRLPLG